MCIGGCADCEEDDEEEGLEVEECCHDGGFERCRCGVIGDDIEV